MSIFLSQDDIKNIDAQETQKKILSAISQYVKEIAAKTGGMIEIDVFPATEENPEHGEPIFTTKSSFLKLIGSFEGPNDLSENHDRYL
jgi:hypothetical protein